jgi:hypothetical protein
MQVIREGGQHIAGLGQPTLCHHTQMLWAQDLGDGRRDLSSDAHAVEHVVCCYLAGDLTEERVLGAELA